MSWISELTGRREWSFFKTLTDFTQLGTKLDPILNYTLSEKSARYQAVSNLNSSPHRLETFHVDCKHSWPSVNEHYSYVQSIILYDRWVVVENLIRKKERASRLCHSRVVSLFQPHLYCTTFIAKMLLLLMQFCQSL